MKFSIVTPVLNGMPQIKRCVGSVRHQRPVVMEHIVGDACSTDGTTQWLLEQTDLLVESKPDTGMYDAINQGWSRASGDVLSWLNADEQYLPGTLERVEDCFASHPSVDAVFGDYILADAHTGEPVAARREIPLRRIYLLDGPLYAMTCTLFFRRRLLDRGLLHFCDSFKIVGDADLVFRLLDSDVRFLHVPEYLSVFGVTADNLSRRDKAASEVALIRKLHGGPRTVYGRLAIRLIRWTEKALAGCYGSRPIEYRFCLGADGESRMIRVPRLGTRWSWKP